MGDYTREDALADLNYLFPGREWQMRRERLAAYITTLETERDRAMSAVAELDRLHDEVEAENRVLEKALEAACHEVARNEHPLARAARGAECLSETDKVYPTKYGTVSHTDATVRYWRDYFMAKAREIGEVPLTDTPT